MSRWRWGIFFLLERVKKTSRDLFFLQIVLQMSPIFDLFFHSISTRHIINLIVSASGKAWTSRCEENNSSCRRVRMSRGPQDGDLEWFRLREGWNIVCVLVETRLLKIMLEHCSIFKGFFNDFSDLFLTVFQIRYQFQTLVSLGMGAVEIPP